MKTLRTSLLLMTALLATAALPLRAQDQFGHAVAVRGAEVFVLKHAGRGPAALYLYRRGADGAWTPAQRVAPPDADRTGEGFGGAIALAGDALLVASGDPHLRFGAQVLRRDADGRWEPARRLPLAADTTPRTTPIALDFPTILRIVQPPERAVAATARRAAVAVPNGPPALYGISVFERDDAGRWTERARLVPDGITRRARLGAALAMGRDRIVAGAPGHGAPGAVFVFARDASGAWHHEAMLAPADSAFPRGFGSAVLWDGDALLVGAPGRADAPGVVVVYGRDAASESWVERGRLRRGEAGDRFGAALALHADELWIGAPAADSARGRVHRFRREASAPAGWRDTGTLAPPGAEPGAGFGHALALGADAAVVGAPRARGGRGRAIAYARLPDGAWSTGQWLAPGGDLAPVAGTEVRCADGAAASFACRDVDLLAFLPIAALGGDAGERVSDLWGWTDPLTGREYALVGRTAGAAIVDVTEPTAPVYLGVVPGNRAGPRDLKVYRDHLFFVGDGAGDHGLLVFDLARLRDVREPPVTFTPDARYDSIASAHNLAIDTTAGFAYPVGANSGGRTCGGGLHMVDVRDPRRPTFAGCYTDTVGLIAPGRTHDAQCVVYQGPDLAHQGRQICFASNETALRIVDVTDKASPLPLAAAAYPGVAYVHQGWLTDDHRYFYQNDELDELVGLVDRTRTLVWDVTDLDDPVVVAEYFGPDGATDHNLYVKGDRMYQANYQAGMRVVDISDRERPVEIGFFDTTPEDGNPPGFNGAWTAYPYFASGTVIVSSMHEGLFVLRPRDRRPLP